MARVAQFYTLDALLAATLVITAVVLLGQVSTSQAHELQTSYAAQDVLLSLNQLPLADQPHTWIPAVINDTALQAEDSVLYAIGYLWTINDSRASELAAIIDQAVPDRFGMRLELQEEELFVREKATSNRVSASVQQITGIDEAKPIAGTSSSAHLVRVRDKQTSSFALFGGFHGQGNLTRTLTLPADLTEERVRALELELDTPAPFTLHINNEVCETLTPQEEAMVPDFWDVSSCAEHLQPGNNEIQLTYTNLSAAYVAGGQLKARFTTDELTSPTDFTSTTYAFPGITGAVNLYDGFVVPQTLTDLEVYLNYQATDNDTLSYLSIGEVTVYEHHGNGSFEVTLTNEDLQALDYTRLSNTTVPIRFASITTSQQVVTGGDADVVLVTDYSGSMKKSIQDYSQGNAGNVKNCAAVYEDEHIRRTHLARCLNKEVVDILLNFTGNRLWPTHFVDNEVHTYYNPEDQEALTGYFETFTNNFPQQGSGQTCVACALSEAYEVFAQESASNRSRFIILMSDGLPTHCTAAGCNAHSSVYGEQQCVGICDVEGQNCGEWEHICTDGSCDPAISNTLQLAQDLRDDFNVTIHTVGFGPVDTCSPATQLLVDLAELTNGTAAWSTDPQDLRDIYQEISFEILDAISFESQTAIIPSGNFSPSTLDPSSYIKATHEPYSTDAGQQQIEITRQTEPLSPGTATVEFPEELTIQSAVLTSYSGPHWTDVVVVNDVTVYNLSNYFVSYQRLGDPYRISLPNNLLDAQNTITVRTGDSPDNQTASSEANTIIYTGRVPAASTRTPVLERAEGCTWTIENVDGSTQTSTVPAAYNGSNTCSYTSQEISYDTQDSMQVAVYSLLEQLDFDNDGSIFISLEAEDLEIILTEISSVPFLWGPILMRAEVWQ